MDMAKKPPEKEQDDGDDTKRDQVLKRLLGTPPKPKHPKAQSTGKRTAKKEKGSQ
jgi:hypothetical protein